MPECAPKYSNKGMVRNYQWYLDNLASFEANPASPTASRGSRACWASPRSSSRKTGLKIED
ncbi:MAG: hypothetical protein R3A10_00585 [Caldilineaceae bacterium]